MTEHMPSVLITGGAGYIGSHIVYALKELGVDPIIYDNLSTGHREAVSGCSLIEGNIADTGLLERTLRENKVEAVIHMAAFTEVGASVRNPHLCYMQNVYGGLCVLDAMMRTGVERIVFSSSAAVYGTPRQMPIPEDHPKEPINPYGATKLIFERILRTYGDAYGLKHVSLRYFNAAGADRELRTGERHEPESHLIPRILGTLTGRYNRFSIFGTDYPTPDGSCVRDYVHVEDLARAHVRALGCIDDLDGSSHALNLGTGKGYSVKEVIQAAERVTGKSIPTKDSARRPGDPPDLVADPSRANEVLDWHPEYTDLDPIVRSAWEWMCKGNE